MADRLDIDRKFMKLAAPLLSDGRWREMTRFVQHGRTTCLTHCMAVAYYSLLFVEVLRIPCDRRSLVRGALLHDYFLYDWHESGSGTASTALRIPQQRLKMRRGTLI